MNNKFLDAYRNLENELRYENKTVLDYENSLQDSNTQEKLKLCRITRNYFAHQDTKFASATKEMTDFLNDLTRKININSHTVKDEMLKLKTIYLNENIKNIIPLCAKNKVPVVDKKTNKVLYIIDSQFLVEQLAKGNKKIVLPKKLPKYNYIDKNARLDKLKGLYIVTSDGTEKGKYLGILEV